MPCLEPRSGRPGCSHARSNRSPDWSDDGKLVEPVPPRNTVGRELSVGPDRLASGCRSQESTFIRSAVQRSMRATTPVGAAGLAATAWKAGLRPSAPVDPLPRPPRLELVQPFGQLLVGAEDQGSTWPESAGKAHGGGALHVEVEVGEGEIAARHQVEWAIGRRA